MNQVHSLSGRLGFGVVTAPLLAILAAAACAPIYAYVDVYTPLVLITVVGAAVFGSVLGQAVALGAYAGHLRNAAVAHAIGFVAGLFGWALSWAWFVWVLLRQGDDAIGGRELANLLSDPAMVWTIATEIARQGWFSVFGVTPTNGALWTIWLLEAVLIVGTATLLAATRLDGAVYCETSRRWLPRWSRPILLQLPEASLEGIDPLDLDTLERLLPASPDEFPRLAIEVHSHPESPTAAFRVKLQVQKIEKEGRSVEDISTSPTLLLQPGEVERFRQLAERIPPAATRDEGTIESPRSLQTGA